MSDFTMPRVSKCDRTAACPEPLDHHERCPKFDAEFWSKVQIRNRGEESAYDFSAAPDAAGIEAALAAGLAAHGPMSYGKTSDGRFGWFCGGPCGRLFIGDVYPTQARRLHDAHVAAALLPVVTQAQAEALREAADRWTQGAWADVMLPKPTPPAVPVIAYANRMGDWLRARANESGGAADA